MKEQGCSSNEIAEATKQVSEQFGIILPEFYVRPETTTMKTVNDMIDHIFSQPRGRGHKRPTYEDFVVSQITLVNKSLCDNKGDKEK